MGLRQDRCRWYYSSTQVTSGIDVAFSSQGVRIVASRSPKCARRRSRRLGRILMRIQVLVKYIRLFCVIIIARAWAFGNVRSRKLHRAFKRIANLRADNVRYWSTYVRRYFLKNRLTCEARYRLCPVDTWLGRRLSGIDTNNFVYKKDRLQ